MTLRPNAFSLLVLLSLLATAGAPAAMRQSTKPAQPAKIEANPQQGFHQPYLLVIPKEIRPGAPIIVALPTPPTSTDPAQFLAAAQRMAVNAGPMLAQLEAPLLVPVLPRPPVRAGDVFTNLYIPALSRSALLAAEPPLARMDRQVLAMVDDARARLAGEHGVQLHEKAIFVGFSAGGHFASRMAILHPDRVLAAWCGGTGGHPILPLAELQGQRLTYPVGVADLEEVAGKPFDRAALTNVSLFFAQGEADTNESIRREPGPSDSYSQEQSQQILALLGDTGVERLEKAKAIYQEAGARAQFRVYPGAGHEMTPEIVRDLLEFIAGQMPAAESQRP